jgi:peptidoglycan hydrolase-like protein with peptidoglycan-binding domain
MGSVDPDGSDTRYYFEYGTSPNFGETTTTEDAGSGTLDVAVSANLTGLTPDATYFYRLVATNSYGPDYGQSSTFTTNAAPTTTTGTATTVSATSESLAGTVDPNGSDTSYYFEWGTTAAFGHKTPVTDAGAGTTSASVSGTITGLKPDTTYDFALVATSALGTSTGETVTFQAAASSCVAERTVVEEDESALTEAKDALAVDRLDGGSSVTTDEETLSTDEASLTAAQQALTEAKGQAANPNTTFTSLPAVGKVITRGESVYSLGGQPVVLFYGTTTPYRALYLGVSDGPDVTELQQNLIALGFGSGITASDHFSAATEAAVKSWQRSLGVPATGIVALGDLVVEPGPIEVDTVTPTNGAAATAGSAVLTATSTTREVTIDLDADEQSEVKVGDPVTVTLPDNSTTPGVVSSVGTVATTPSSSGNTGTSTPTITVEVTLTDPKATGNLDEAPVTVAITNASVPNALVVPVDALLALSAGGYALEEVGANGSHQLVPVSLGLFDDAAGNVQVTGSGVHVGQKIVIPNT